MRRISSLSERPEPHGLRRLVQRINPVGNGRVHSRVDRRLGTAARAQGPWPARARASNGTGAFPESSIRHLRESGLRENCTSRLSGGRRPALRGASSDPTAKKAANKGARALAESLERRAGTEGNPGGASTGRTQRRGSVSQGAERIRQIIERKPQEKLTALLHHVTPESLADAYRGLQREAAPGMDGMTWEKYGEGLEERLLDLHRRVHTGAYRATPSRRVNIPKPDGGTRPLGVATLEDKIVQKAVVDTILTPIYEAVFLGCSYGFRPGRGAHDALDALAYALDKRKVNWILDADVSKYFDRIDREQLLSFLAERIGDRRLLRLITKWLNAGVMEDCQWSDTGRGTPQGSVVSPLLANVYLHYVLDQWVVRTWRPTETRGEMIIVRYADDFVLGFQYRDDAERFLAALRARFAQFGLELHPDKTRLLEFGRYAAANRKKRG